MTVFEILELWAKHTEYDPEQKSFVLGSNNYEFNKCGKVMTILNTEYDPSGILSLLYAKTMYKQIMEHSKCNLFQLINDPNLLDEYVEMWAAFNSGTVTEAEDALMSAFNQIISTISGTALLGETNKEEDLKLLYTSIESVTESLHKCRVDSFLRSNLPLGKLSSVHPVIEIFPTLAHCLLTLEKRPDGIYICYVSQYGSAGGYFGFYLKSNGNIISINDRIDEAYVGQHGNSRNGRWSESALTDLFPYDELLDFSEHDYKGYATKWAVKKKAEAEGEHSAAEETEAEECTEFHLKDLNRETYMALVLAVVLLTRKYSNSYAEDAQKMLVDSLLQKNFALLEQSTNCTSLIPRESSAILKATNEWQPNMTTGQIVSGELNTKFNYRGNEEKLIRKNDKIVNYNDFGIFANIQSVFVDLYAEGFELDTAKLLYAPDRLQLTDGGSITLRHKEFIGSEQKMALECYRQARRQLADYIEDQMLAEYIRFGGDDAVAAWYKNLVHDNKQMIFDLAVDTYIAVENGEMRNSHRSPWAVSCSKKLEVCIENETKHYGTTEFILNTSSELHPSPGEKEPYAEKWICPVTGTTANVWITFFPCAYQEIERIFQCEVPKIIKGWSQTGPDEFAQGNSILNSTDAVAFIEHPYQLTNHSRRRENYRGIKRRDFHFTVGFSKRGLNALIKQRKADRPEAPVLQED